MQATVDHGSIVAGSASAIQVALHHSEGFNLWTGYVRCAAFCISGRLEPTPTQDLHCGEPGWGRRSAPDVCFLTGCKLYFIIELYLALLYPILNFQSGETMRLPLHQAEGGGVLSEWLTESLRQSILNGCFDPGERLDQVGIAEAYGVSLTPVREALRRLSR